MEHGSSFKQAGMTLVGLIFVLALLAMMAVLGMKVFSAITEYFGVKKAIAGAKAAGPDARNIKAAFDKQAEVGYIDAISGKDLEITRNGEEVEVSFSYQKKIPLFEPVSLVFDFEGTTAKTPLIKKPVEK